MLHYSLSIRLREEMSWITVVDVHKLCILYSSCGVCTKITNIGEIISAITIYTGASTCWHTAMNSRCGQTVLRSGEVSHCGMSFTCRNSRSDTKRWISTVGELYFAVIFSLHPDVQTHHIALTEALTSTTFTKSLFDRYLWINKEQSRGDSIGEKKSKIFSLVCLDFPLVADEQTSGFVEPRVLSIEIP
jgi:hypothetical protein